MLLRKAFCIKSGKLVEETRIDITIQEKIG